MFLEYVRGAAASRPSRWLSSFLLAAVPVVAGGGECPGCDGVVLESSAMVVAGLPPTSGHDAVIVGSGPAGLTLATTLAEHGRRVLVIESGGDGEARPELSSSLGYGHFSGGYWNDHWIRAVGGTSNVWTGWCLTGRDIDFDNPVVGVRWPIGRADLLPYWKRAAPVLDRDPRFIDFEAPLIEGFAYRPVSTAAPTRFGQKFGDLLRTSARIDVATGCTVVRLDANASRSTVTRLECFDHARGTAHALPVAPGRPVILAAGGLGNAQLLLQPREDGGVPVGNESGVAGAFLMEHPQFNLAGECAIDIELDRYWPADNPGSGMHVVSATRELSLAEHLYGCGLQCSRKSADHPMARFLTSEHGRPFFHYEITARAEMRPSAGNRVAATLEQDRSGLRRLTATCVIDGDDFRNVEATLRAFGQALMTRGRGRVRVNNDRIYKSVWGQGHTLGTTRMGRSRADSVVDAHCRVHGYDNLYIAGSSVFPSGGYANPTLTIVALALRLADHLESRT